MTPPLQTEVWRGRNSHCLAEKVEHWWELYVREAWRDGSDQVVFDREAGGSRS